MLFILVLPNISRTGSESQKRSVCRAARKRSPFKLNGHHGNHLARAVYSRVAFIVFGSSPKLKPASMGFSTSNWKFHHQSTSNS